MTDTLRTRIAAAIYNACDDYTQKFLVRPDCPGASELEGDGKPVCYVLADAVIREVGPIPDRTHVDDQGRIWEWCGGQPGTWAWRITAVEVDVKCAVCKRTYGVRADAPGWSAVWTCCISCQANEENEWLKRDKK